MDSVSPTSAPLFRPSETFSGQGPGYELMPFRYARLPAVPGDVLITTPVGEYMFLRKEDFSQFANHTLKRETHLYRSLRTRQFLRDAEQEPFARGIEAQQRTRKLFAEEGPALHIFVVTLRCDHRCHYCQVSPRRVSENGFDMTVETADAALDRVFESDAPCLTIEFQGGESALNFEIIKYIIDRAECHERKEGQTLRFVLATTLHLLSRDMLKFCRDHNVELSTSLDGPAKIHNGNRVNQARNSYELTLDGIARAREICGPDSVSALTTITRQSLPYAREIIDTYLELGFDSISLRPLSPYGFAAKSKNKIGYTVNEYLKFYRQALDYLVELNCSGNSIEESYASLLLTRILTPFPTSYVDLQSPAAAGTSVLVYHYDGSVYASDEGRMLAEMGDDRFRMGSVHDTLADLQKSDALKIIRDAGVAEELPGCSECAFVPYCGADPIFHVATQGDPIGHRPTSQFCQTHTGFFRILFEHLSRRDPEIMKVFLAWISRRSYSEIGHPGYLG